VTIYACDGGEANAATFEISQDDVTPEDSVVHVCVPLRQAWDNVHHACSTCLPFRREADIDAWCRRHRLPRGEALPVRTLLSLSRGWYRDHRSVAWRRLSGEQASAILREAGLRGDFWSMATPGAGVSG